MWPHGRSGLCLSRRGNSARRCALSSRSEVSAHNNPTELFGGVVMKDNRKREFAETQSRITTLSLDFIAEHWIKILLAQCRDRLTILTQRVRKNLNHFQVPPKSGSVDTLLECAVGEGTGQIEDQTYRGIRRNKPRCSKLV